MSKFVALAKPYALPPREYEIKGAPKVPKLTVYIREDGHDGRLFCKVAHVAHAIGYIATNNQLFLGACGDQITRNTDGNKTRFVPVTAVAPALVRFSEIMDKRSTQSTTYKAALNGLNLANWFDETFGSVVLPQIPVVQSTPEPVTHNPPPVCRVKRKYPVATLLGTLDTPTETQMRIYEIEDEDTLFIYGADILIALGQNSHNFTTRLNAPKGNLLLRSCQINNIPIVKLLLPHTRCSRPCSLVDLRQVPAMLETYISLIKNKHARHKRDAGYITKAQSLLPWLTETVMPLFYESDNSEPQPADKRKTRPITDPKIANETPEQRAKRLNYLKGWRARMTDEQRQKKRDATRRWHENLTDEQREYWHKYHREYMRAYNATYPAKVRAEYSEAIN